MMMMMVSSTLARDSFVLLGYDINLRGAKQQFGAYGGVVMLYLLGQMLDIGTTLAAAYLMFTVVTPKS
jgi:hypothetical protein